MNILYKLNILLSFLIVAILPIGILTSHGSVPAGYIDWGDIAYALAFVLIYVWCVIDIYNRHI